jgi:F-type H+-transporting ATPase subunit gamma
MAQDWEKAQSRLLNIKAVRPILGALRTISLGNWQLAINKRHDIVQYNNQLIALVAHLLLELENRKATAKNRHETNVSRINQNRLIVGIGTERGLCGRYNSILAQSISQLITESQELGYTVQVGLLGSRLSRTLYRDGLVPEWSERMPVNRLPVFHMADTMTRGWLRMHQSGQISQVLIVYNKQQVAGRYQPWASQLIPATLPELPVVDTWPPYIIETDPVDLLARVLFQWTVAQFYSYLLEAGVTEHSARYQLMESASQNADRLVDELTISIQSGRRQQITREIQELAVGAGLIGRET